MYPPIFIAGCHSLNKQRKENDMTCYVQNRRGRPTGYKMSQHSKDMISKSRKGYVHDEETKEKISNTITKYFDGQGIMKGKYRMVMVDGKYIQEHRVIAEKVLGRPLKKGEVVHHINGNCADNRNENLVIMTRSGHAMLHHKMIKLAKHHNAYDRAKKRKPMEMKIYFDSGVDNR